MNPRIEYYIEPDYPTLSFLLKKVVFTENTSPTEYYAGVVERWIICNDKSSKHLAHFISKTKAKVELDKLIEVDKKYNDFQKEQLELYMTVYT